MLSNILSGGLTPVAAPGAPLGRTDASGAEHKAQAAPVAAPAPEYTDADDSDPVREATNLDQLYDEAEAIRLQTPPPTPRCGPLAEGRPLNAGLLAAPASRKAPAAVDSILFPALVMETKPRTRAKSRHRSAVRADESKAKPERPGGIMTPTTASQTHLASSVGMDAPALAGA